MNKKLLYSAKVCGGGYYTLSNLNLSAGKGAVRYE